ncbi:hypothetical protein C0993_003041 [Termitomyces sp. T159_Od127]|nr:hypothetical protein C0993_003041 [Termitomyces sp. T159_Od127]
MGNSHVRSFRFMSCATDHSHFAPYEQSDAALLDILTASAKPTPKAVFVRRDAALDPLLIAAAAASGPQVTRNHYHHDFFPGVMMPKHEGSYDWTKFAGDDKSQRKRFTYVSRQAPRRQRLHPTPDDGKENNPHNGEPGPTKSSDFLAKKRHPSVNPTHDITQRTAVLSPSVSVPIAPPLPPVQVKCMARTRIPTPHGPAFLHLYHNNRDTKEHLAIVIDPAQLSDSSGPISAPPIRSRTLDAIWEGETEMDRITRGAYVGRLSATSQRVSEPPSASLKCKSDPTIPSPLIRIHSECFTGETIGSMRCDCGEQLDEAIRQISLPITIPTLPHGQPTIPGRGAVVYLRQEGRGIGLLSKIRAYNLQDLGHDTVTANLMLGHQADERGYEIAGAILRDLGLGETDSEGVRVLTNNPDKVEALQKEGLRVVERVPMIPRSWQKRRPELVNKPTTESNPYIVQPGEESDMITGVTMIGGKAVYGNDLDKYLRTKVVKMGHILPLWMEEELA